ncbi:MAG: 3'-5' exonuclease [Myxococcales bacterium]|nr:3'-5' exonuclease [Myxococcales bacterium]MCB9541545.1 3'-5' exonuclease [Myxococcales bacterium]
MKLTHALLLTLDAETTGPDPHADRIVELGGAYLQAGEQVGPRLVTLVDPRKYIPAGATQVHGIRTEDVDGAPTWPEIAARLERHFAAGPVVVGYNILGFDKPLIDAENAREGIDWRVPAPLDPFLWAYWHDRGKRSRKLGPTCERYGIALAEDAAHTADADAIVAGQLLIRMVQEGVIPDDVDEAFREQALIERHIAAELARFGRFLYRDRHDGVVKLGLGKHIGLPLHDADEGYLRWMLNRPELPAEARSLVMQALGQAEQAALF